MDERQTRERRFDREGPEGGAAQTGPRDRARARRDAPDGPDDRSARSWLGVVGRTFKEFRADNLTDWAAALTYYGVLALFPAVIALVSIVGLLGQSTIDALISNIQAIPAPGGQGSGKQLVLDTINNISQHKSQAGIAF